MDREIKFRVWDGEDMSNDPVIPLGMSLAPINMLFSINTWVFMQYTGLKDRNGNKSMKAILLNIQRWILIIHI